MIVKIQYSSNEERELIISDNPDKYLIEEQNTDEGNFLIFTDILPVKAEIKKLKQTVADLTEIVLLGGM